MSAGDLKDLKVLQHRFTARVDGPSSARLINDVSKGRYLVLRLRAEKGDGEDRIWAHDFVVAYTHPGNGQEDRAATKGIGAAFSSDDMGLHDFSLGDEPYVVVKGSQVDIGIFAYVEPDVTDVEICRVGAAPLPYHIGDKRPFSVYVVSNSGPERSAKVAEDLRADNFSVDTAGGLNESAVGVRVIYAKGREAEGREVAARVGNVLGTTPTVVVREDNMTSEYDVLVWLGK